MPRSKQAKVAQLVEHSTENAGVISSILILGTFYFLDNASRRMRSTLTRCFCLSFNAIVATIVTQPFTAKDFKKERSISCSSLRPILNLEIPDLAVTA